MKKFWNKHKGAIVTGITTLVVGLKLGSKYHESVQKGFNGVSSAGKATGKAIKTGATQTCNYVSGMFSKKTPENNN